MITDVSAAMAPGSAAVAPGTGAAGTDSTLFQTEHREGGESAAGRRRGHRRTLPGPFHSIVHSAGLQQTARLSALLQVSDKNTLIYSCD